METKQPKKDMTNALDPDVALCTSSGTDHDYRPYAHEQGKKVTWFWRCVWCHTIGCGSIAETDPCIEPFMHKTPHRTVMGLRWPSGERRPDLTKIKRYREEEDCEDEF